MTLLAPGPASGQRLEVSERIRAVLQGYGQRASIMASDGLHDGLSITSTELGIGFFAGAQYSVWMVLPRLCKYCDISRYFYCACHEVCIATA